MYYKYVKFVSAKLIQIIVVVSLYVTPVFFCFSNSPIEVVPLFGPPSKRLPYENALIKMFVNTPLLHPPSSCQDYMKDAMLNWNQIIDARNCIDSGICYHSSTEGLVIDLVQTDSSIEEKKQKNKFNTKHVDGLKLRYPEILGRVFTKQDWSLLRNWKTMKAASVFYGQPTLRFKQFGNIKNSKNLRDSRLNTICPQLNTNLKSTAISNQVCPKLEVLESREVLYDTLKEIDNQAIYSDTCPFIFEEYTYLTSKNPKDWVIPVTLPLHKTEHIVTFIEPLGSGKESEVWRVCVNSLSSMRHFKNGAASVDILALKIPRRTFLYPSNDNELTNRTQQTRIPGHKSVWSKLQQSLCDTVFFSGLISSQVILFPNHLYSIQGQHLIRQRDAALLTQYTLYLGLAGAYTVINEDLSVKASKKKITERELACWGRQLLQGLIEFDTFGYVWLDCKPQNILVDKNVCKIGDPGLIRPVGTRMRAPGIGTQGYRPFEAFKRSSKYIYVSSASAVFSLGATLYYAAYNRVPWREAEIIAIMKKIARNREVKNLHFPRIDENPLGIMGQGLLNSMLHLNPELRIDLNKLLVHPFWNKCTL